jgi:hypothetical protein
LCGAVADPIQIIDQFVEVWQGSLPRTAPVFRVVREAAAIDPETATLERDRAAQRLHNYETAARLLDERGALPDGLTIDQAAAAIFAIGHPDTYRTLVLDGNWDDRQSSASRGGGGSGGDVLDHAPELLRRGEVDVLGVLKRLRGAPRSPIERLPSDKVLVPVHSVHPHPALDHVPPMRARAQIVRQTLRSGAQVRARRQPNESDRQPILITQPNLDTAVRDHDRDVLTSDGSHPAAPLPQDR